MEERVVKQAAGGGGKARKTVLAVCAALVLVGIVAYAVQQIGGMESYANHAPWGIYIVVFYCAAGLGAGSLIVGGIAVAADLIERPALSKLFVVVAAAFVVASACVIADLGSPAALISMIVTPNLAGPLFYDMLILAAGIIAGIVGAWYLRRSSVNRPAFAVISIAVGVLVLAIEAWLLSITYAHEAWNLLLGFTPALAQAGVLGLAAAAALCPQSKGIARALAIGIAAVVLAEGIEALIGIKDTLAGAQLAAFIGSPLFWLAVVAAIAAVVLALRGTGVWGAATAFASIVLLKAAAIWAGQAISITDAQTFLGGFGIGWIELLVSVGIVALGVLVYVAAGMLFEGKQKDASQAKAVIA